MMDVFLHTEFQSLLEQAQTLIDERTNHSCGKAKGMLLKALNNPLLQLEAAGDNVMVQGWSDDIKCARALIYHMLGQAWEARIATEADVVTALESLRKCLELFESVSNEGVKLKFLNVLQQTYNLTG